MGFYLVQNHISNLINESTDIKNNESKLEIVLTKLKDDYLKYKFSAVSYNFFKTVKNITSRTFLTKGTTTYKRYFA